MDDDVTPTRSAGLTRRAFFRVSAAGALTLYVVGAGGLPQAVAEAAPGRLLPPGDIPKFRTPLLVPPVMPRAGTKRLRGGALADYYQVSVRQFQQQVLPAGMPATTVWGYGAVASEDGTGLLHHAPSLTIEATWNTPVVVRWINDLTDERGRYLPHLLAVDPTLHWANPPGGRRGRDTRPTFRSTPMRYTGPVPLVTHVHGMAGVTDDSDGYAEAWYLPDARNIPDGYATKGTWYRFFRQKAEASHGVAWGRGFVEYVYPNSQRESTLWYHDHTLGMTRLNVYAGPAGFYLVRGGPAGDAALVDSRTGRRAVLPGPAPRAGDPFPSDTAYREIPLAIQDRAFNDDGSLFYPDSRAFFDGIEGPYIPDSDLSPIWNPEFFGNALIVNGATWPTLTVEQRRYRFRVLNGCQARFLLLDFGSIPGARAWVIGNEGGFLPEPVDLRRVSGNRLQVSPAERYDVVVDFARVPVGRHVLRNVGPDGPFAGGAPGTDFPVADPESTGQVMELRVVPARGPDRTTPPRFLQLPPVQLMRGGRVRPLALLEDMSQTFPVAPATLALGNVGPGGTWKPMLWMDPVTENPSVGDTEVWEFYNATPDAHPMHIHEVLFQVVDRQPIEVDPEGRTVRLVPGSAASGPRPWERGYKDTVTAYPGHVTRVRLRFERPGQFVWHCHIVEHEDNEMMRPYRIGPQQPGQPKGGT